jgi:deoxyribodipyrimidine photolyase
MSPRHVITKANGKRDKSGETVLKEVLWWEFSYLLPHHWPHLPEQPFNPEYADFPWASDSNGNFPTDLRRNAAHAWYRVGQVWTDIFEETYLEYQPAILTI